MIKAICTMVDVDNMTMRLRLIEGLPKLKGIAPGMRVCVISEEAMQQSLKLFRFTTEGSCMGGCAVVVAQNESQALEVLRNKLENKNLDPSYAEPEGQPIEIVGPIAALFNDGDL